MRTRSTDRVTRRGLSAAAVLETLESRQLMSAAPVATLLADGYEKITWKGQEAYAKPGQWIARVGGLNGDGKGHLAAQLSKLASKLSGAGTKLNVTRHLGDLGRDGVLLINAPTTMKHGEVQTALQQGIGGVVTVEPDFAVWAQTTDTYYSLEWGLDNTGQSGGTADADIDAPEAWSLSPNKGSGVVVGEIDTGVNYNHPDLAAHIFTNTGEIAGDGIDNDGDGYVDDVHGWDFANGDSDPMDDNGHGTHVAGTIAAVSNNGQGVAGVSDASIMPLKFLGADGSGSTSDAVAALNYAAMMRRTYGVNIRVTNNSWGGGGYSSALFDAIKANNDAGIMFVAAAGNGGSDGVGDNNDTTANYPSNYDLPNVIAVAATDRNDRLASFSNYGSTTVDLAAPGVSIASTYYDGGYVYMDGTSMATPHVSGVAALAWGASPSASVADVRAALLGGADPISSLSGKTVSGGRLNAANTLQLLSAPVTPTPTLTAPDAPTSLGATAASSTQVNLNWTDISTNETGFKIERSTAGGAFTQIATVGAGVTTYADTGRAANTTYTYRVRATNAAGDSDYSNTASVTTPAAATKPAAPTSLVATALSTSQIRLTWKDNSGNESGFKIERSTNGTSWTQIGTVTANTVAVTNTGLRRNTLYYYRVRAYNAVGNSAYTNVSSVRTKNTTTTASTGTSTAALTSPFSTSPIATTLAADQKKDAATVLA